MLNHELMPFVHCRPFVIGNLGFWVFLFWSFVISPSFAQEQKNAEYRTWTTVGGRKSDVKLKVVDLNETHVQLQRQDNSKTVVLKIEQLSVGDQAHLRTLSASGKTARPAQTKTKLKPDEKTFAGVVQPVLRKHCLKCHGPEKQEANFRVDEHLPNEFVTRVNVRRWSEVLNVLNTGDMPPEGEPRPNAADVARVAEWIENERLRGERARNEAAVVLRRMNREEYNNTIRHLVGVNFRPGDNFPEDPPAAGFDNVGAALTVSPAHLELYLKAAQEIVDRALPSGSKPPSVKWRFPMAERVKKDHDIYVKRPGHDGKELRVQSQAFAGGIRDGMVVIEKYRWNRNCLLTGLDTHYPGDYAIRVRAAQWQPTRQEIIESGVKIRGESLRRTLETDPAYHYGPPRMKVKAVSTHETLSTFDVVAPASAPKVYEIRVRLPRDPTRSTEGIQIFNEYIVDNLSWHMWEHDDFPKPRLLIDWIEFEGPIIDQWPPVSEQRILFDSPNRSDEKKYAREVLTKFMTRAYRRPVTGEEVQLKFDLFHQVRQSKSSFKEAIKVSLIAVLTSPHFLYLVEPESLNETRRLNNYELASRLSYFLWSSMPDDELFQLAATGRLSDPNVLTTQVDRMLADDLAEALSKNFAGQWLKLRNVDRNPPVRELFARYDAHVHESKVRETIGFFRYILQNDRPVTDFIQSGYVTINERMARFYGIPGVKGDHIRAVPVPPKVKRGGLLGQASILGVTSNGTRTSPVWRGVWILENMLGDPVPPPPPNAGTVPPPKEDLTHASLRDRMRIHRDRPQCVRCHQKIDPLGFALEHYNGAGNWRERDSGDSPHGYVSDKHPLIDATAQLPDGTKVDGLSGLQKELLQRREQFYACLARKMMVYATGRPLGFGDDDAVDEAVEAMRSNPTLRTLIKHIVTSEMFQRK